MSNKSINLKAELQQDNVYPESKIVTMQSLTGMPSRKGMECAVISGNKIVNVVSDGYGHLPNENFFTVVEENLINADIDFKTRSINRADQSFAVDYILNDDSYVVKVKSGKDTIRPMLRFTNSYDGSTRTTGNFGFFREVCKNGLHVANTSIGFSVKHYGSIAQIVMPHLETIVEKFMDNEFYSLHKKFEILAEKSVSNIEEYVKLVCDVTKIFKFETSEKNPAPSMRARQVIETVERESHMLDSNANRWLVYNSFNELLHNGMKKGFEQQRSLDTRLLDVITYN